MHGLYSIKVVKQGGGEVVADYHGESHPLPGGSLVLPDGQRFIVKNVSHMLKESRNGSQVYITFSHVVLTVISEWEASHGA